MPGVIHPLWFMVGLVVWLVVVTVFAWWVERTTPLYDDDELPEVFGLSAPVDACSWPRVGSSSPPSRGAGPGRGGQRARELAQERAAAAALRCDGRRVQASPTRCPVDGDPDRGRLMGAQPVVDRAGLRLLARRTDADGCQPGVTVVDGELYFDVEVILRSNGIPVSAENVECAARLLVQAATELGMSATIVDDDERHATGAGPL